MPFKPRENLVGKVFGTLTVIRYITRSENGTNRARWLCRCQCGNETAADPYKLKTGRSRHCGCLKGKHVSIGKTKHGNSYSEEWHAWKNMIGRCTKEKHQMYKRYGGRGISVADRWMIFDNFYADMGKRPSKKHSIDRINNNGNYEPGNCRWATRKEQAYNKSTNALISINGKTQCITAWSEETGLHSETIRSRIKNGVTGEALLLPARRLVRSVTV